MLCVNAYCFGLVNFMTKYWYKMKPPSIIKENIKNLIESKRENHVCWTCKYVGFWRSYEWHGLYIQMRNYFLLIHLVNKEFKQYHSKSICSHAKWMRVVHICMISLHFEKKNIQWGLHSNTCTPVILHLIFINW